MAGPVGTAGARGSDPRVAGIRLQKNPVESSSQRQPPPSPLTPLARTGLTAAVATSATYSPMLWLVVTVIAMDLLFGEKTPEYDTAGGSTSTRSAPLSTFLSTS